MMEKGNTPVLGSGRIHDFSETKSGNRSGQQPKIQQRQGFGPWSPRHRTWISRKNQGARCAQLAIFLKDERKGFFVARGSNANYCQTPLSLWSSLNLEYLDDLFKGLGKNQAKLRELIDRNNLAATLHHLGYKFVTFSTGFDPTDLTDADRYLSPYEQFTGFQRFLIDQTLL